MARVRLIDGMRGYFLVFMLINHLNFTGDYWLVRFNLRELAFIEDAQGFVFLSGLLVGMIYAKRMLGHGFAFGAKAIHRRAGQIYVHAIALIVLILLAAAIVPASHRAWGDWLGDLGLGRPSGLIPAALLIFQPSFLDILPQYIIYMLIAPPIVWACAKGHCAEVAIGSFIVWLAAQAGLHLPVTTTLNAWLTAHGQLGVRGSFDLLAWQVVFFTATGLGVLTATGRVSWREVFAPQRTWIPKTALAVCLLFLPLRIVTAHGLMSGPLLDHFNLFASRPDFGLVYLVNFIAGATGLTWLLIGGPQASRAWVRRLARMLTAVFEAPFLRLLGRHSLEVYCWHVLLVYSIRYWDVSAGPFPEALKIALGLACIPLLAIPPLLLERRWSDGSASGRAVDAGPSPEGLKSETQG